MRLFQRGDLYFIPRSFLQLAADTYHGVFLEKEDTWQQVVFLCSDSVYFGFWLQKADGKIDHQLAGLDLDQLHLIPGLRALWERKNIGQTWDELSARFMGRKSVKDTVQELVNSNIRSKDN